MNEFDIIEVTQTYSFTRHVTLAKSFFLVCLKYAAHTNWYRPFKLSYTILI